MYVRVDIISYYKKSEFVINFYEIIYIATWYLKDLSTRYQLFNKDIIYFKQHNLRKTED